jgi:hypothetical protein
MIVCWLINTASSITLLLVEFMLLILMPGPALVECLHVYCTSLIDLPQVGWVFLLLQVDLSSCDDASLCALHACSGLTPPGFGRWLATRTSGIVLLSRDWGLRLSASKQQQQLYGAQLAEQGYDPLAETEEGLLLVSPAARQHLQDALHVAAKQTQLGISTSAISISSRCTDDQDGQPSKDQRTWSAWWAFVGGTAASGMRSSRGDGGQGQDRDGRSNAPGSGETPLSGNDTPVAAVPSERCMACNLSLAWQPSVAPGLAPSSSSSSDNRATSLVVNIACQLPNSGVALKLGLMMAACLKAEVSSDRCSLHARVRSILSHPNCPWSGQCSPM